ncbi:MAG: hypothetical protein ACXVXO_12595 [Mycobacteriaceae bacterium]
MSATSHSNFVPANPTPRPGRRNVKKAWALAVSGAVAAAVTAGCTTLPQLPGGGSASGAPVAADGASAPARVASPRHAPDDFSQTLPNPNARVSADGGQQPHGTVSPRIATQFIHRTDLPQETSWVGWGKTPLTTWDSDAQPAVRFIQNATGFGATTYVGHDPTIGRAADIRPTSAANGTKLANWLMANTGPLGIQYIVWSGQIYNIARASDGVRYLSNRGSVTQNHQDHVHVTFRTPGPIAVNTAAVGPWTTDYRKTVFIGCPDIRRGSTGTCARDWQHFLNLWFGARATKLVEDGNFGAATESRQRTWEAEARAWPWNSTVVVKNGVVQGPEYTQARNHLLFFGIKW